jgi:hypothetical protein
MCLDAPGNVVARDDRTLARFGRNSHGELNERSCVRLADLLRWATGD